jgi:hypothetical protein
METILVFKVSCVNLPTIKEQDHDEKQNYRESNGFIFEARL